VVNRDGLDALLPQFVEELGNARLNVVDYLVA